MLDLSTVRSDVHPLWRPPHSDTETVIKTDKTYLHLEL